MRVGARRSLATIESLEKAGLRADRATRHHGPMPSTSPRPERPSAPPEADIRAIFDSVARRYDVVNALLSFGLDRKWRRAAARSMAVRRGDIVLDLGCGTGELGRLFAGRCRVVGLDLSLEMLKVARRRIPTESFVQASALRLPFRAAGFSAAVSAFLLRN